MGMPVASCDAPPSMIPKPGSGRKTTPEKTTAFGSESAASPSMIPKPGSGSKTTAAAAAAEPRESRGEKNRSEVSVDCTVGATLGTELENVATVETDNTVDMLRNPHKEPTVGVTLRTELENVATVETDNTVDM